MDWFKKHTDAVIVLGGILTSVIWMNAKFSHVYEKLNEIDKDIVMVKTVMIMQKIMPPELASKAEENR